MYLWAFWNGVDNACFWSPAYLPHNDWLAPQQNHGIKKTQTHKALAQPHGARSGCFYSGNSALHRRAPGRNGARYANAHWLLITDTSGASQSSMDSLPWREITARPRTSEALPRSPEAATPPFSQSTVPLSGFLPGNRYELPPTPWLLSVDYLPISPSQHFRLLFPHK